MHGKVVLALILFVFVMLIDWRFYRLIRSVTSNLRVPIARGVALVLWSFTAVVLGTIAWYNLAAFLGITVGLSQTLFTAVMCLYAPKLLTLLVVLPKDVLDLVKNLSAKRRREAIAGQPMSRGAFVEKMALAVGAVPFTASVFGVLYGAYDYEVKIKSISLPNLPSAFDGLRMVVFADAHVSDHYRKQAFASGIDLLMEQKGDLICFAGDLVNYRTSEAKNFVSVLQRVKAPLGVFSITGNHDYGDYIAWPSEQEKKKNFQEFIHLNRELGYELLLNENRKIVAGSDALVVIGVENWGTGRFPRYGNLDEACMGTEDSAVKILLSHDPSHWDAQIRPDHPEIDLTLSGHTHGFQMGVQMENFQWSPAQYIYKQWAGLYQQGNQLLYVNQGFGCLGYLGRIGMPPEITVLELKKG
jgi:hypothetical protein